MLVANAEIASSAMTIRFRRNSACLPPLVMAAVCCYRLDSNSVAVLGVAITISVRSTSGRLPFLPW